MWIIFEIGTGNFVRINYKRLGGSDEVAVSIGDKYQRYSTQLRDAWKFGTEHEAICAALPGEAAAQVSLVLGVTP